MKRVVLLGAAILGAMLVVSSCGGQSSVKDNGATELVYFHGPKQCPTCVAIATVSREVVNQNFAEDVSKGKIDFRVVDISVPEGRSEADLYRVAMSGLILKGGGRSVDLTAQGFQYARKQPDHFRQILHDSIKTFLDE